MWKRIKKLFRIKRATPLSENKNVVWYKPLQGWRDRVSPNNYSVFNPCWVIQQQMATLAETLVDLKTGDGDKAYNVFWYHGEKSFKPPCFQLWVQCASNDRKDIRTSLKAYLKLLIVMDLAQNSELFVKLAKDESMGPWITGQLITKSKIDNPNKKSNEQTR